MFSMSTSDPGASVNRRHFLKQTCTLAGGVVLAETSLTEALGAAGGVPTVTDAGAKPNVLFLMVDQLRLPTWDLAKMPLPAYELLRRTGMTFESMYCSSTPCTPSRATILTGLHMTQHGLEINVCKAVPKLNPSIPTLGHYFQFAGYRTPYFGKWHLSTSDEYAQVGLTPYGFEELPFQDLQGTPGQGATDDPGIADKAIAWLNAYAASKNPQPWLLFCSLVNPHDIMYYKAAVQETEVYAEYTTELPPNFEDDLSTKPKAHAQYQKLWGTMFKMQASGASAASTTDWLRAMDYYYDLARKADDQLMRVLERANDPAWAENTIVVFLSDHGELAGAHRMMGKGPFAYEESVHVPMVISWKGRIPAGTVTKSLAQTVDVLPTLLDLVGIVPAGNYLPGKSLKPVLLGSPSTTVNDHVIFCYGMSIAQTISEYADYGATMPPGISPAPWKFHAIRDASFKYARYFEEETTALEEEHELYDVLEDAPELKNLAGKQGHLADEARMAAKLTQAEKTEMAPIAPSFFNAPFGAVLRMARSSDTQVVLRFDTQKDIQYQAQVTTDFAQWSDVGSTLLGTGDELEVAIVLATAGKGFYRVKRL